MQFCSVSHLDEVDDTDTGSIRFSQMTPALLVREEFGGGGSLWRIAATLEFFWTIYCAYDVGLSKDEGADFEEEVVEVTCPLDEDTK